MMPPGGQMPPEDLQRFLDEREHQQKIAQWYQENLARIELEHRKRVLHWGAILCDCRMEDRTHPCPVHGNVLVTLDGQVL